MTLFADRLVAATQRQGPLCIGLDPHPESIPAFFGANPLSALSNWCEAVVQEAAQYSGVLKPQIGLFEPYGPDGLAIYQQSLAHARSLGIVTISDAKRGDIGSTAKGYARAYLAKGGAFESDAVTVNPYLGRDSLKPFIDVAIDAGKGVIVLGRTSNAGADDIQTQTIDGRPVFERVVASYAKETEALMGASGWSGLMWVVGATAPDAARTLRRTSPKSLFLIPGFGAQGGGLNDALAGFVRGQDGVGLSGGVVNASRAATATPEMMAAQTIETWRLAARDAMECLQKQLVDAVR